MDVLMLVWSDVSVDARVQREARTLAEAGHRVHVVGRAVDPAWVPPPGVTVSSAGSAPTSAARSRPLPAPLRLARWLLLPEHVRRMHRRWERAAETDASARTFDVVHAHDFTALPLGSRLAEARGVPLVYDAHEFWPGRDRHGRPTPILRRRERAIERRVGSRASRVVTVGDELADLLRGAYGWGDVAIVRNSFAIAPDEPGPASERPAGVVYAGRLGAGRDLETVVTAVDAIGPLRTVLVGPADGGYLARLPARGVEVRPAVPLEEAVDILRDEGVALVTLDDRWLNNRIGMPNKLFMAVRAGVPVVAADLPALRRVVTEHGLGALYRPGDPASYAAAVARVVEGYAGFVRAVSAARPVLSWDRDAAALLAVYAGLAREPGR